MQIPALMGLMKFGEFQFVGGVGLKKSQGRTDEQVKQIMPIAIL